jgi:hypothetical protein
MKLHPTSPVVLCPFGTERDSLVFTELDDIDGHFKISVFRKPSNAKRQSCLLPT